MLKNKASYLLSFLLGCGNNEINTLPPWEQVQGCWSVMPDSTQARELLVLQLVLAETEPDISALKYSKLSEEERVLVAKWRIERQQNPEHPRWSGIEQRISLLSESSLCFEPEAVVFKKLASEERLEIAVHEERDGHVQLSHGGDIWDLWWSEPMAIDFSRTGLAPIRLKRVED